MKKIFIETPFLDETSFNGYLLSHLSYGDFFKKNRKLSNIIKNGYSGSSLFSRFRNPELIQKMYLEKDPEYFTFLSAFKERYSDFDIIFMNPGVDLVHPEYLIKNFPNAIKVLHFVDDPHASYSYGFPYSWAFDAATYISPSYSENYSMEEILNLVGFKNTKWFPLCSNNVGDPEYTLEDKWRVTYQSRIGPGWLKPFTDKELNMLPGKGIKKIDVISPSFVIDNLETLEEINIEGRQDFLAAGGEKFNYIPCLNTRKDWVTVLNNLSKK